MSETCSVCGHPYDSHGSHSWCENKPCDCEQIPIVDELQRKLNILLEVLGHSERRLLELRDEELVKDLSVFKSCAMRIYSDIKDALKKLEEK